MRRFRLTRSYTAVRDGKQYGPWDAGQLVQLEPEEFAWIERDSPGALLDLGHNAGERIDDDPHADPAHTTDASPPARSSSKTGKRS